MRLTTFTSYALRTLMFAAARGDQLSRSHEIAEAFGASRAHLNKCIYELGQWGYLKNVRGRHGGFRLAKPPHEITIGEVVRRTEERVHLIDDMDQRALDSELTNYSKLRDTFDRAWTQFMDELDAVTIADVAANPQALDRLWSVAASEKTH